MVLSNFDFDMIQETEYEKIDMAAECVEINQFHDTCKKNFIQNPQYPNPTIFFFFKN